MNGSTNFLNVLMFPILADLMSNSEVGNVFKKSREKVTKEIEQFVLALNEKKLELFDEIELLETEYKNIQKQKQNDVERLAALKLQTEELGQNTLVEVQRKILEDIQAGMDKLNLECQAPPDYEIDIEWGFCNNCLITKIEDSKIMKVTQTESNSINNLNPLMNSPTSSLEEDLRLNSVRGRDDVTIYNDWDDVSPVRSANGFKNERERWRGDDWDDGWGDKTGVHSKPGIRQNVGNEYDTKEIFVNNNQENPRNSLIGFKTRGGWDRERFIDEKDQIPNSVQPKKQRRRIKNRKNSAWIPSAAPVGGGLRNNNPIDRGDADVQDDWDR